MRYLFILLFSFCSFFTIIANHQHDNELVDSYLSISSDLDQNSASDDLNNIIHLLDQFRPNLSDYYYLKGNQALKNQDNLTALEYFVKSMELDNWKYYSYLESARPLFALNNHLNLYRETISYYNTIPIIYKNDLDLLLQLCWAYYYTNNYNMANSCINRAIQIDPYDLRFYEIDIEINGLENWPRFLYYSLDSNIEGIEGLFRRIILRGNGNREIIEFYSERYNSVLSNYLLIRQSSEIDVNDINILVNEYSNLDLAVLDLIYNESSADVKKTLLDRTIMLINSGSEAYYDYEQDGSIELRISSTENPAIIKYMFDEDGDGLIEMSVDWNYVAGHPVSNFQNYEERTIKRIYGQWPWITEARVKYSNINRNYMIQYGKYESDIEISNNPWLLNCFDFSSSEKNSEDILYENSIKIHEYRDSIPFRAYTLVSGSVIMITEDSDLNGKPDHLLSIENGIILAGLRDIDEDGHYDLHDCYSNGTWIGVAFDSDNDNLTEYYEDWNLFSIKLWDWDQDDYLDIFYVSTLNSEEVITTPLEERPFEKEDFLFWDFSEFNHWFY